MHVKVGPTCGQFAFSQLSHFSPPKLLPRQRLCSGGPARLRCGAELEGKRPDPLGSESPLPSKANNDATPVPDRGGSNGAQGPPRGGSGGGGDSGGEWSSDSGAGIPQLVAYLYALLIAFGGYMGYKKKGSKASLQASSVLAAILILSGVLLGGKFAMLGAALALGANLALGWYMLKGYRQTRKPFPQGVLSLISGLNVLLFLKELNRQYFIWTRLT